MVCLQLYGVLVCGIIFIFKVLIIQLIHLLRIKGITGNLLLIYNTYYLANIVELILKAYHLKDRENYSKYIYNLHEIINKMLNKKSGLTYNEIRNRYEHFRSRCTDKTKVFKFKKIKNPKSRVTRKHKKSKERGCTEPLYGKKSKCVIKIVPQEEKCNTFQMDKKCIKKR
jgi:hypothetical protein